MAKTVLLVGGVGAGLVVEVDDRMMYMDLTASPPLDLSKPVPPQCTRETYKIGRFHGEKQDYFIGVREGDCAVKLMIDSYIEAHKGNNQNG